MTTPFGTVWFWLLILSIVLFVIAFVLFETTGETNTDAESTSIWVWILLGVGLIVWTIALIWFAISQMNYHKCREQAIACGDIVPDPEPVIECERDKCYRDTPCGRFESGSLRQEVAAPVSVVTPTQTVMYSADGVRVPTQTATSSSVETTQQLRQRVAALGSPQQPLNMESYMGLQQTNIPQPVAAPGPRVTVQAEGAQQGIGLGANPIGLGPNPIGLGPDQAFSAGGIEPLQSLAQAL